jgi:hypothetical protein
VENWKKLGIGFVEREREGGGGREGDGVYVVVEEVIIIG